jgi:hypothetical protein
MKDLVVNYVDAPPGTGKTRACLELMRRHVKSGASGDPVGYIFYVAPTLDLLRQTIAGLHERLPRKLHSFIRAVRGSEQTMGRDRTEHQVYALLNGRHDSKLDIEPFVHGSILFLTHATFLKLKRHKKFGQTRVIFDESRKWVVQQTLRMDEPGVKDLFNALFVVRPLKDYAGINELVARAVPENQKRHLISTKHSAREFKKLDMLHTSLSSGAGPVRLRVYAVTNGKVMLQIMLPSHPFVGFKDVHILSAAFERSQMYHLFRSENIILQNVTRPFMNTYLDQGYGMALDAIGERQSKLELVPLLADTGVPSKYQLSSGVVLPKKNVLALTKTKNELGIATGDMRDVVAHLKDPVFNAGILKDNHRKLVIKFGELRAQTSILDWQLRTAERLARQWFSKYGQPHKGLLFLNKNDEDVSTSKRLFTKVSLGKAEGNNGYQSSNLVVFLAAVNPTPQTSTILNAIIPEYDADEDYVIDKAVQCIGRGNIRNHDSDEKMLAIVSTMKMAESIARQMNHAPIIRRDITKKLGNYVTWTTNLSRAEEAALNGTKKERRAAAKRKEWQKIRSDPIASQLNSLRSMRSTAKKAGNEARIQELESSIQALIKERDEQKKWSTKKVPS